jgi:hypothetical protein
MLTAWLWRMRPFSDRTHGVGATFAQLEGDRRMERSSIYHTCCTKGVLRRICGHQGPLKIACCAPQERTHSCCF